MPPRKAAEALPLPNTAGGRIRDENPCVFGGPAAANPRDFRGRLESGGRDAGREGAGCLGQNAPADYEAAERRLGQAPQAPGVPAAGPFKPDDDRD